MTRFYSAGLGRFCITERGYAGVVPKITQVGDILCLIHGAPVPFLIRKSGVMDGHYQLVGGCYIHGIMYGKAMSFSNVETEKLRIH